jgi:hypothetical protein
VHSLAAPPRPEGLGSRGNGGELPFLALATCYGKDLHREANQRGIRAESVEVRVSGEFGAEGASGAKPSRYRRGFGPRARHGNSMRHADPVAEMQPGLRQSPNVVLMPGVVRDSKALTQSAGRRT